MLRYLFLLFLWFILVSTCSIGYFIVGVLSVTLAFLLFHKLSNTTTRDYFKYNLNKRSPWYFIWLIYQIKLANLAIIKEIFRPKPNIKPQFITLDVKNMAPSAITLLANSITITPGTVSIHHANNKLHIHAFNDDSASGIHDMKKQVLLTAKPLSR